MYTVKVEKRDGKAKAKQLRRNGIVPCSVYGGALTQPVSLQMTRKAANQMCTTAMEGSTVLLDLEGKKLPVMIKEMARPMVGADVEHMAFQALQADQKVNSVVHILVKNGEMVQGVVEQMLFEVPFTALPEDLLDTVTVDLEGKPVGTVITVADIPELQSETVEVHAEKDSMVLRIRDKNREADAEETPAE